MNKTLFHLLIINTSVILFTSCLSRSSKNVNSNFRLIFVDNFNKNVLDTSKWSVIDRNRKGWNKEGFESGEFVKIQDGKLIINAYYKKDSNGNDSLIIGGVQTKNKVFIKYGKVEVRAKLTKTKGLNSAIWMLADKPKYGKGNPEFRKYTHYNGEIDILERINNEDTARNNIHTYNTFNKLDKSPANIIKLKVKEFHIYSVEILPEEIRFFIDGKITLKFERDKKNEFKQYPFDQEYYLMIEMLTGEWPGPVTGEHLPAKMFIDWVKIYELI